MKQVPLLTENEKEILYGCILGDLYCETQRVDQKTFRLRFEAGEKHKEYLFHLYDIFSHWTYKEPKKYERIYHLGNKVTTWRFHTIATEEFGAIARDFYPHGNKIVPRTLFQSIYMTEKALAYWFMDDGSYEKKGRKALILHTEGFSIDEVEFLCKGLRDKWNIHCSRHMSKKRYPYIYIWARSLSKLTELLSPYLIQCMQYKLKIPNTEVDDIV